MHRRSFLRRSGRAALGAATLGALPCWASTKPPFEIAEVRFDVDWRRVQPTGRGPGNARGLSHYSRLVDRLLERGWAPVPTLCSGRLPRPLLTQGGWAERATAERFAEYAGTVAGALGDRVRTWVLLREPSVFLRAAHPDFEGYLPATHVANLSVGQGYRAIRAASTEARIGSVVRFDVFQGLTDSAEHEAAAERCRRFELGWFVDPVLNGFYPGAFLDRFPYDRMRIENADLGVTRVPLDFVGLRAGQRRTVASDPTLSPGTGLSYGVRSTGESASRQALHEAVGRFEAEYRAPRCVTVLETV